MKFDPTEYTTARGHLLRIGDAVQVTTPCHYDDLGATVVELLPRHAGDVPDVRLRNHAGATLITNAFCVEPLEHICRWTRHGYTCWTSARAVQEAES